MAKANNNPLESNIEITFELLNNENGESIDSAEIYVIEGWTGTIFYQKIIQSQETISIIPNHSFRFKLIHQDFETWYSKSEVYSSSESITVNFTNGNENYENITDNQVNNTGGEVELEFLEHMSTNSNLNFSLKFVTCSFFVFLGSPRFLQEVIFCGFGPPKRSSRSCLRGLFAGILECAQRLEGNNSSKLFRIAP